MSKGTGNLAAVEEPKQGDNRMETGLSEREELLQAAELIKESALGWRESNQIPVLLLRALAELTLRNPDDADQGFKADVLAAQVAKERGKVWLPAGLDKEETNRRVREPWNTLTDKIWLNKRLGLKDRAEEKGWNFRAKLDRIEGGGTGNRTRYRLIQEPVVLQQEDALEHSDGFEQFENGCDIRYVREDFEKTGRWLRFVFGKVSLKGWRLGIFLFLIAAAVAISGLLLFVLGVSVWYQMSLKVIGQLAIGTAVILWLIWSEFGPILNLPSKRITFAPSWIQVLRWDSDVLLEWCAPPRYDSKFISAVHYTGACPLCGGKVEIESGGFRYFGRLIGRCRESPREHIFSFDHVTRSGRKLG
jgi:hypothetical protein